MRILHVCLANFYIDGYTYQENMVTKYHAMQGHDVRILASTETFIDNVSLGYIEPKEYIGDNDISVHRISYVKCLPEKLAHKLRIYSGVYDELVRFKPALIFIHGLQFVSIKDVARYVRDNPNVKVVVDCHADFSNSARNWLSREILHKIVYKWCAKQILPFATKFYGVLPARCDFLHDVYGIPKDKIDFLPMGADDELVKKYASVEVQQKIRAEFGYKPDDFVIVTGGKIDKAKTQVLTLMRAVNSLPENVKLLIFGSVDKDLRQEFDALCSDRVRYMGWTDAEGSYKYFSVADVVCFPGRHSVYWEQAVAQEKPLIVKWWQGTTHVDYQGNVKFLYKDSGEEMRQVLHDVMRPEILRGMQEVAKIAAPNFLYGEIAKKVLKDVGLL